jgi:imidazolonepropionase-like amidohydrolase
LATQAAAWGALGFIPLDKLENPRVSEPTEAHDAVTKLLDSGVDGVKLYAVTIGRNGIPLPDPAIASVVNEAHKRGKIVFAHPTTAVGLMASVKAGVDVLAHVTPQSGPWDDTIVDAMKQAGVALIPTLALWKYELRHERVSIGDAYSETAVGQLRKWVTAGGVVLFGTDVGYMTEYDPADEYTLMSQAGMTFSQILSSLTTAPAQRFGVSKELGRIAQGFTADLTILKGDPSKEIRALADVQFTLRDGRIIYRR